MYMVKEMFSRCHVDATKWTVGWELHGTMEQKSYGSEMLLSAHNHIQERVVKLPSLLTCIGSGCQPRDSN